MKNYLSKKHRKTHIPKGMGFPVEKMVKYNKKIKNFLNVVIHDDKKYNTWMTGDEIYD